MLFNLLLKPTSEKFRFKHAICDYIVEPPTENQEKNPNQRLLPVKFQTPFNGPVTDVLKLMLRESTSCPNMWYQKRR